MKIISLCFLILMMPIVGQANLEIEAFHLFEGDRHGDFKDNIVISLSDGSQWKVHPEQTAEVNSWKIGASISLSPRTDSYLIKREHKFSMTNKDIDKSVKIMLISYNQEESLVISDIIDYFYTDYKWDLVPVWDFYNWRYTYHLQYVPYTVYGKTVTLSDGTEWMIEEDFDSFRMNQPVYVIHPETSQEATPVLIIGNEREAIWFSQ